MVLYILTGYRVLSILSLNQLLGACHTQISYHYSRKVCKNWQTISYIITTITLDRKFHSWAFSGTICIHILSKPTPFPSGTDIWNINFTSTQFLNNCLSMLTVRLLTESIFLLFRLTEKIFFVQKQNIFISFLF